ncbi:MULTISPECIES: hypothetical protein [Pantoea]|uniref:DUF3811 domain-containing protein n=2 Tax=Pantoea TaxID=53335 RepID=A0A0U3T3A5_9GAMM|nr:MULTISPECIES: hypothetical protein [Pantoea]ALV92276.1 hypothetical protein LK04_09000 [Pantoea vagans]KHJ69347.1 hypothetical protein QU24_04095 [Pantoea rodasii]
MSDKKMISIDQFNEAERGEVDEIFKGLMQKHRLRSGKEPDAKKEKEYTAEARQQVMSLKLAKEKAKADKAKKTPTRRKKPEAQSASEVSDFSWSASVIKGRR